MYYIILNPKHLFKEPVAASDPFNEVDSLIVNVSSLASLSQCVHAFPEAFLPDQLDTTELLKFFKVDEQNCSPSVCDLEGRGTDDQDRIVRIGVNLRCKHMCRKNEAFAQASGAGFAPVVQRPPFTWKTQAKKGQRRSLNSQNEEENLTARGLKSAFNSGLNLIPDAA
ncbi:hypothetical protein T265_08793 [Opisthorchis viverrini]|uniref:Uncharacterized protein n=1 Tax=Opisthorchis viverrini TaxID=6198 RepID=A0A075A789_OPIVI|nr:hypothetical protein T265_08793 [Opisthorchis viverrini]KER23309.1 hypothetical protein T265_08793 [Opisthorchis viverrini]